MTGAEQEYRLLRDTALWKYLGVAIGSTPGLAEPIAMAISLPILISIFGFTPDALLPVMGFLIGIMKGATIGGAVPAILFNTLAQRAPI